MNSTNDLATHLENGPQLITDLSGESRRLSRFRGDSNDADDAEKRSKKREWDAQYARNKRRRDKEQREKLQEQYEHLLQVKTNLEIDNGKLEESIQQTRNMFQRFASPTQLASLEAELSQVPQFLSSTAQIRHSAAPLSEINGDMESTSLALQLLVQLMMPQSTSSEQAHADTNNDLPVPGHLQDDSQPYNFSDSIIQNLIRALQPVQEQLMCVPPQSQIGMLSTSIPEELIDAQSASESFVATDITQVEQLMQMLSQAQTQSQACSQVPLPQKLHEVEEGGNQVLFDMLASCIMK